MAAAAIGGAVGSIVSQGVGIAMGMQKDISWKGVATAAIGSGVSAGVGYAFGGEAALTTTVNNTSVANVSNIVGRTLVSSAVTQGVNMAVGLQKSFSWSAVAAAGASAWVGSKVGSYLGEQVGTEHAWQRGFNSTASGIVSGTTASVIRGGRVDMARIATDAFGNALGNGIADALKPNEAIPYSVDFSKRDPYKYANSGYGGIGGTTGGSDVGSAFAANAFSDDVASRVQANGADAAFWNQAYPDPSADVGSTDPANYGEPPSYHVVRKGEGLLAAANALVQGSQADAQAALGAMARTGQLSVNRATGLQYIYPGQTIAYDSNVSDDQYLADLERGQKVAVAADAKLADIRQAKINIRLQAESNYYKTDDGDIACRGTSEPQAPPPLPTNANNEILHSVGPWDGRIRRSAAEEYIIQSRGGLDPVHGDAYHYMQSLNAQDEILGWGMGPVASPLLKYASKGSAIIRRTLLSESQLARAEINALFRSGLEQDLIAATPIELYGSRSVKAANRGASLSEQAQKLYSQGKYREALDVHYEDMVRQKVGGTSQVINGREIDAVTDTSLIQVKRTYSAVDKPENFLNKSTRNQIKATIDTANEQGKTAEFWFKYGVHPKVRSYIETKGGVVKTGLGD